MEHMESKMQDRMEGWDARDAETLAIGRVAGLRRAAEILREYAAWNERGAAHSKRVAESQGMTFAAVILRSYANSLDIEADMAHP